MVNPMECETRLQLYRAATRRIDLHGWRMPTAAPRRRPADAAAATFVRLAALPGLGRLLARRAPAPAA